MFQKGFSVPEMFLVGLKRSVGIVIPSGSEAFSEGLGRIVETAGSQQFWQYFLEEPVLQRNLEKLLELQVP